MMKNFIFLFIAIFFCNISIAQTKLIFHKSHSGNSADFSLALENRMDFGGSDFGQAPPRDIVLRKAVLDSLICLSDSTVVMVTSETCRIQGTIDTSIWKAGRDTILYSPYFSNRKTEEEIRGMLDDEFYFNNPASSVVMIGFNEKKKIERDTTAPPPSNKLFGGETINVSSKKELRKYKRQEKKRIRKEKKAAKKAAKRRTSFLKDNSELNGEVIVCSVPVGGKQDSVRNAMRFGTVSVLSLIAMLLFMTFWKMRK